MNVWLHFRKMINITVREVDRVLETLMRRVWIPRRNVGLNTNQFRVFSKHPTIPHYIWVFIWSIMLPPHHLYLPDGPYQVCNFSGVYKIPFIFVRLRPSPTQNTVARWSKSLQPVTLPEPPPQITSLHFFSSFTGPDIVLIIRFCFSP